MTVNQENQAQIPEQKPTDKEFNFRQLEARHQRELMVERGKREEAERIVKETLSQRNDQEVDEDNSEPYIDHNRLNKALNKHSQATQSEIQKAMEFAKQKAKEELKQELWLEQNPDFYNVLQHAENFAQKAPALAETILKMPEGFERQKLVYQNIKHLGFDKPETKQPSIQEKMDANRRSPYYQPSGVGTSPYNAGQGDFSPSGQKNAYAKMQE